MNRTWRTIILISGAQVAVIGYLLWSERQLRSEPAAPAIVSAKAPALESLQEENSRLRGELAKIPELSAEAKRLEKEIATREAQAAELWNGQSNQLQTAIDQTRREIQAFQDWSKDYDRMKLRERANARLAQKAGAPPKTAEETSREYEQLDQSLQQVALNLKRQMELRRDWQKAEKTKEAKEAHVARMSAAWSAFEGSRKQIGEDMALFEDLPVANLDGDLSNKPVLRSIVPDSRGLSATVYLDGSVVWTQAGR